MVLPIAYFPPIEYFCLLLRADDFAISSVGNYQKQSYRNRCRVLSTDGVLDLSFPIVHGGSKLITEIEVDYATPWVKKTQKALDTAYYSSPFFEYYRDELFALLDNCPKTLWQLDMSIIEFLCKKIGLVVPSICAEVAEDIIHPKKTPILTNAPYYQVFGDKFGFIPNLSVLDLLFCEGPESICYLSSSEYTAPGRS